MINKIWNIHYALVKGIYKKRWKGFVFSVDALATICLVIFALSLFLLIVDPAVYWDMVRKRRPYGPIGKGIFFVVGIILLFFFSGKNEGKIETIRKVVLFKRKVSRKVSVFYVSFFVLLFILSLTRMQLLITPR